MAEKFVLYFTVYFPLYITTNSIQRPRIKRQRCCTGLGLERDPILSKRCVKIGGSPHEQKFTPTQVSHFYYYINTHITYRWSSDNTPHIISHYYEVNIYTHHHIRGYSSPKRQSLFFFFFFLGEGQSLFLYHINPNIIILGLIISVGLPLIMMRLTIRPATLVRQYIHSGRPIGTDWGSAIPSIVGVISCVWGEIDKCIILSFENVSLISCVRSKGCINSTLKDSAF
uniref:ASET2 n=1 Tax=Medicago sativa TaxID=3879 RepID=Q40327_MEDSA|nr:ASET2 [Medicago sativa]